METLHVGAWNFLGRQPDKHEIIFSCDTCGDCFDPDEDDFKKAWAAAKDEGWRAKEKDGKWLHTCPDCA